MQHNKFNEIHKLIKNNIPVLLTGEAGSGKTTIIKNIAKDLDLPFYSIAMTKQTTLNALLGFISIDGTYIPSQLRKAVENGGLMLLDEIDAGDPNTLLCLNTLENGYLAFPDGIIHAHKDFRLCATANPQDEHNFYTGRSKLDGATLDRFDIITIERDKNLEEFLTCELTVKQIHIMRELLIENGVSNKISMRDSIRFFKRKAINLASDYEKTLLKNDDLYIQYKEEAAKLKPLITNQAECKTIDELWTTINSIAKLNAKELQ